MLHSQVANLRHGRLPTGAARSGFTLIELILVMTLMAILTSVAMPSLSKFFRGRAVDSEARQLLSLTHAGQSRAISEGFPALLWIDVPGRTYGLELETTSRKKNSQDVDAKAEEFEFSEKVQVEALDATPVAVSGNKKLPAIRFLPDGSIDETSPSRFRITGLNGEALWLVEATNRLSYAIRSADR